MKKKSNFMKVSVLLAIISTSLMPQMIAASLKENENAALFSIFPRSDAPTYLNIPSDLVFIDKFVPWTSISNWSKEVDEKDIFLAELQHQSLHERSWAIKIGKGGQLYSIASSWGESMPPQSASSPWNDDVWQSTVLDSKILDNDKALDGYANAFIHQSGMYVRPKMDPLSTKPFHSPILAAAFNKEDRCYSVVCWGQIPTPSVNRADSLLYVNYRDLGDGVIEITYACFNFGSYALNDLSFPWGGVRTSVFPEEVLGKMKGGYEFFTPFNYGFQGCHVDLKDTGGWMAFVENAANPNSYALGLVFGKDRHWEEQNQHKRAGASYYQTAPTVFGSGNSRHGKRDYSVAAVAPRAMVNPGGTFFMRVYLVLGTLTQVQAKAEALADRVDYGLLEIDPATAPKMPIYSKLVGNQTIPTTQPPSEGAKPAFYTYAVPVEGAQPLFLMKETATGKFVVSTDPYALCGKKPFVNPFPPGNPKHNTYQNRVIYQPYDGKTEWIGLLGYAIPKEKISDVSKYISLSAVLGNTGVFVSGEKDSADRLLVSTASK